MKEAGLPEIENVAWMAIMAPASTPTDIVERVNREINAILKTPEIVQKMHAQYMEPIGGSPEDLHAFMETGTQDHDVPSSSGWASRSSSPVIRLTASRRSRLRR